MLDKREQTALDKTILYKALSMPEPRKGQYGVELELEGGNLPPRVEGWNVHNEGSLRGNAKEYVTNGAFNRPDLAVLLDYLTQTFTFNGTHPNFSYRAGTHIHYNMQTRSHDSIVRSIILWCIVEPLFLKICGPNRDGNLFCMSAYDTGDMHIWLRNVFTEFHRHHVVQRFFLQRGKYSSLNVDPLYSFGTLEVRALPNSWNKDEILLWTDYVHAILQDHGMHPREMMKAADSQPENFLRKIFGGLSLPANSISLLGFGVEQAFPLIDIYSEYMGDD